MEDLTGRQFGHYQIVEPIGEGGMAAVYKAYQPSMERHVAVKVLPRHMASSPEFMARFQREARLVAHLQHPNILPVFDFGESDGYTYVVMPYVSNGTLADLLTSRQLNLNEVRRVMVQLCDALAYAHSMGMIHRDLKPSNVLMDARGNCLLTDFGLARMVEATSKLTSSGTIMGTPAYMSPEQGMGNPIDQRSDLYSLGIIFYEMVTGRVPFTAETPLAILFKHVQDPLPSALSLNPNLPEEVELVLLKALAKSPDDRYQNAQEMMSAIQAALHEPAPPIMPRSGPPPVSVMERKTDLGALAPVRAQAAAEAPKPGLRITPGLVAAILVVAALIGLASALIWNKPAEPAATATRPSPTREIASATNTPRPAATATKANTPAPGSSGDFAPSSSSWIVYGVGNGQDSNDDDPRYLYMKNSQTGEERRLTFDEGGDNFPSFSPDGKEIVFTGCKDYDCKLYILNLLRNKVEKVPGIDLKAMFPEWCPADANLITFEGRDSRDNRMVYIVERASGKVTPVTSGPADGSPAWSPDCSRIVFERNFTNQSDIYVVDLKTGEQYAIVVNDADDGQPIWSPDGDTVIFTRVSEDTNGDTFITNNDRLDLYQVNADGGNERILLRGQYSVFSPFFSFDGSQIVFCDFNYLTDLQQIVIYSVKFGSTTNITAPGTYYHTEWSP